MELLLLVSTTIVVTDVQFLWHVPLNEIKSVYEPDFSNQFLIIFEFPHQAIKNIYF